MAVRKLKPVEANDGSYGGMVLAAFDSLTDAALLADICDNMAEVLKPLPGIASQTAIAELCEGLREARAVISVLMDTAADFTEVDQQNCEHARLLCRRLEALLSKHSPDAPGQHAGTRATESGDGGEA